MREFADAAVKRTIIGAIFEAITAGRKLEDVIGRTHLIIDPKQADDPQEYAAQLCWTYYVVTHGGVKSRSKYQNLVPDFKKQLTKQLRALGRLDISDPRAVLQWLIDARITILCPWVWTDQINNQVVRDLKEALPRTAHKPEGRELIAEAVAALSRPDRELSSEWISAAARWLKRNR